VYISNTKPCHGMHVQTISIWYQSHSSISTSTPILQCRPRALQLWPISLSIGLGETLLGQLHHLESPDLGRCLWCPPRQTPRWHRFCSKQDDPSWAGRQDYEGRSKSNVYQLVCTRSAIAEFSLQLRDQGGPRANCHGAFCCWPLAHYNGDVLFLVPGMDRSLTV
jgi:hypothetical protein